MVLRAAEKVDMSCTGHPVTLEQGRLRSRHGEGMMLVLEDPKSKAGELKGISYYLMIWSC